MVVIVVQRDFLQKSCKVSCLLGCHIPGHPAAPESACRCGGGGGVVGGIELVLPSSAHNLSFQRVSQLFEDSD